MYLVVRIEDPYGLARTGMDAKVEPMRMGSFVNARIQGREIENLVALPRYILRAGNLLWVIDKDNILRNRQVEMLRTGGDQIYVTAGLDEGDLVCLTLMDPSFTGATVAVRTTTATDQLMQLSRAEAVAE
jgi:multidrug efflux pump subunit AcrA (membrane-fusion protein)